jgi:hypothetical protein
MPGFKLAFTLVAAAAIAIGKYVFDHKDDEDDPTPRDPYQSSPSYNSGTWNQTQQPYRPSPQSYRQPPPPPPSHSYRSTTINAHSKTTTRTPVPLDYSHDGCPHCTSEALPRTPSKTTIRTPVSPDYGFDDWTYHTSEALAQMPSQTQLSTRTQTSRSYSSHLSHVRKPPEYEYSHTSSHTSQIYTRSESRLPTAPAVVSSDLRSDEPAIVEDPNSPKKLREQARRKGREMSEARSRAKSAQKKGYRGAANAHRQEAMAYEREMKDFDKRAAKIIFQENNKNRREGGKIDLHGLHVAEAIQFAKEELQSAKSRGDKIVRFIPGESFNKTCRIYV